MTERLTSSEHDVEVDQVRKRLDGLTEREVRSLAAELFVKNQRDEVANAKAFTMLKEVAATRMASPLALTGAFAAGVDHGAASVVGLIVAGMPELNAMSRKKCADDANAARHSNDPKTLAMEAIRLRWLEKRKVTPKGRWFSEFAGDMVDAYPDIEDPRSITRCITAWEETYTSTK